MFRIVFEAELTGVVVFLNGRGCVVGIAVANEPVLERIAFALRL
jgi:hypothetical protein